MKPKHNNLLLWAAALLIACGLGLAVSSPFGSDRTLLGVGISLLGIVIFAPAAAASVAYDVETGATRPSGARPFLRLLSFVILIAGLLTCLKFSYHDIDMVQTLKSEGVKIQATVISRDRLPTSVVTGRVIYAYRAEKIAVEDSFPIPRARYGEYWVGRPLLLTYLPGNARVHLLGAVTGAALAHQLLLWTLIVLNVLGLLGMPALLLEMRTRASGAMAHG